MVRTCQLLASITLGLGIIAFVVALISRVSQMPSVLGFAPRSVLGGAIALFLLSIAAHLEARRKDV